MIPAAFAILICAWTTIPIGPHRIAAAMGAPTVVPQFPLMKWGSQGTAEGQFSYPSAITLDAEGNIYIADGNNYRIQKFDHKGRFVRMWGWGVSDGSDLFQICTSGCQEGLVGGSDGQFTTMVGLAFDAADNLHVVDLSQDQVQKFDRDGSFLLRWGVFGSSEGQFDGASGAAVGPNGELYVLDNYLHRAQRFDLSGNSERLWGWGVQNGTSTFQICQTGCQTGLSGTGNGQFHFPARVAVDSSGNVYVSDQSNNRVQKFTSNGVYLAKFGTTGSGDGQLNRPAGLWVDSRDNVYVADSDNNRVVQFDSGGTFFRTFGWGVRDGSATFQVCASGCQQGISGSGDGQFDGVVDLVGDRFSNLYVVDGGNHRIQNLGPALGIFVGDRGHPGETDSSLLLGDPASENRLQLAGARR